MLKRQKFQFPTLYSHIILHYMVVQFLLVTTLTSLFTILILITTKLPVLYYNLQLLSICLFKIYELFVTGNGSAVYVLDSYFQVTRSGFQNNTCLSFGTVYLREVTSSSFGNIIFSGNLAYSGAAVFSEFSNLSFEYCLFDNTALNEGMIKII